MSWPKPTTKRAAMSCVNTSGCSATSRLDVDKRGRSRHGQKRWVGLPGLQGERQHCGLWRLLRLLPLQRGRHHRGRAWHTTYKLSQGPQPQSSRPIIYRLPNGRSQVHSSRFHGWQWRRGLGGQGARGGDHPYHWRRACTPPRLRHKVCMQQCEAPEPMRGRRCLQGGQGREECTCVVRRCSISGVLPCIVSPQAQAGRVASPH